MYVKAANGDHRAQKQVLDQLRRIEDEQHQLLIAHNDRLIKYKSGWSRFIAEARAAGDPEPELIPHPDDIIVDINTGRVEIHGAQTKEQKQRIDKAIARRDDYQRGIFDIRTEWEKAVGTEDEGVWLSEWHHAQLLFDTINDNLPLRHRTELKGRSFSEGASMAGSQAQIHIPENAQINPKFADPPGQPQTAPASDKGSTRRRRAAR